MAKVAKNKSDEQSKEVKLSFNQYDTLTMGVIKSKALAYALAEIAQSDAEIDSGHLLSLAMMLEEYLQKAGTYCRGFTKKHLEHKESDKTLTSPWGNLGASLIDRRNEP
ncbi:MAG: hypothetical protein OEZ31_10040 [Nitrospirota bacterium]|nr:hypothetical protein [Nitrospirota bacterium]